MTLEILKGYLPPEYKHKQTVKKVEEDKLPCKWDIDGKVNLENFTSKHPLAQF